MIVNGMGEKRGSLQKEESAELRQGWEKPSYAIFDAMEEWFDINWLDEEPLIKTIDLDAIDRFFEDRGDRSLSFEYDGSSITLSREGGVQEIKLD